MHTSRFFLIWYTSSTYICLDLVSDYVSRLDLLRHCHLNKYFGGQVSSLL